MENILEEFNSNKKFLICIDFDGCAIDTMDVKHIKCFGSIMVDEWNLNECREEILTSWNNVNLYTLTRGINRFKGLAVALSEIDKKYTKIDGIEEYLKWTRETKELSNESLEKELGKDNLNLTCIRKALEWSKAVNNAIKDLKSEEKKPFEGVREAIIKAKEVADIAIVSSANEKAVLEELEENNLLEYVDIVLTQNIGTKAYYISKLLEKGYEKDNILMVGDAIGDYEAANVNGVLYYPIQVRKERESWKRFEEEALLKFIDGSYRKYYKDNIVEEFKNNLTIHKNRYLKLEERVLNSLEFKSKKILGFGEIMLRLTPPNNQKILQANSFDAVYSGGEANVIASLAMFGHDTKFVTKLPNNYLGQKVINKFRGYNIDVNDVLIGEGRLGIYYSEIGHGLRSTEVIYDRKYSAISMAKKEEFNLDKILNSVGMIHLSGITPALSDELYDFITIVVKECKEKGILVSYDSNFREKLWSVDKAKKLLEEILPYIDIAFLGYLDMVNILKFEDKNINFEENLERLYKILFEKYPNLKYSACTKRIVNSINNNTLRGYLFNGENLLKSNEYTFDILDRVGGGDAFTAGVLHGILKEMDEARTVEFATCASSLKHSIHGDINLVDEATVNTLIDIGLCNIKR